MADEDLRRPAFRYSSAGRRPERLNQSRNVNVPVQLARGWAAGTLGLPGDIEGLVRLREGLSLKPSRAMGVTRDLQPGGPAELPAGYYTEGELLDYARRVNPQASEAALNTWLGRVTREYPMRNAGGEGFARGGAVNAAARDYDPLAVDAMAEELLAAL